VARTDVAADDLIARRRSNSLRGGATTLHVMCPTFGRAAATTGSIVGSMRRYT